MPDKNGVLSSFRPATIGSQNQGPNLFSYNIVDSNAENVSTGISLFSRNSNSLQRNLRSCCTEITSDAKPAKPT